MITTDTVLAPTNCQECAGFDEVRPATVVANYWPEGQNKQVGESVYLCGSCSSNSRTYTNVKPLAKVPAHMVTEEAPEAPVEVVKEVAQQPLPSQPYAPWFQALLDQNLPLTSVEEFEEAAYRGHVSYELGGTDGYYAPEPKEAWVKSFRTHPASALYWGNDSRTELAPYVNDYWVSIQS